MKKIGIDEVAFADRLPRSACAAMQIGIINEAVDDVWSQNIQRMIDSTKNDIARLGGDVPRTSVYFADEYHSDKGCTREEEPEEELSVATDKQALCDLAIGAVADFRAAKFPQQQLCFVQINEASCYVNHKISFSLHPLVYPFSPKLLLACQRDGKLFNAASTIAETKRTPDVIEASIILSAGDLHGHLLLVVEHIAGVKQTTQLTQSPIEHGQEISVLQNEPGIPASPRIAPLKCQSGSPRKLKAEINQRFRNIVKPEKRAQKRKNSPPVSPQVDTESVVVYRQKADLPPQEQGAKCPIKIRVEQTKPLALGEPHISTTDQKDQTAGQKKAKVELDNSSPRFKPVRQLITAENVGKSMVSPSMPTSPQQANKRRQTRGKDKEMDEIKQLIAVQRDMERKAAQQNALGIPQQIEHKELAQLSGKADEGNEKEAQEKAEGIVSSVRQRAKRQSKRSQSAFAEERHALYIESQRPEEILPLPVKKLRGASVDEDSSSRKKDKRKRKAKSKKHQEEEEKQTEREYGDWKSPRYKVTHPWKDDRLNTTLERIPIYQRKPVHWPERSPDRHGLEYRAINRLKGSIHARRRPFSTPAPDQISYAVTQFYDRKDQRIPPYYEGISQPPLIGQANTEKLFQPFSTKDPEIVSSDASAKDESVIRHQVFIRDAQGKVRVQQPPPIPERHEPAFPNEIAGEPIPGTKRKIWSPPTMLLTHVIGTAHPELPSQLIKTIDELKSPRVRRAAKPQKPDARRTSEMRQVMQLSAQKAASVKKLQKSNPRPLKPKARQNQ